MNEYDDLSPNERLNRICELLIRGIYLYAEEERWIEKPTTVVSSYSYSKSHRSRKEKEFIIENKHFDVDQVCNKKLYSLADAAKILKTNKRTLQRWAKSGKIKVVKQENGYLFLPQEELNYLMASNL